VKWRFADLPDVNKRTASAIAKIALAVAQPNGRAQPWIAPGEHAAGAPVASAAHRCLLEVQLHTRREQPALQMPVGRWSDGPKVSTSLERCSRSAG